MLRLTITERLKVCYFSSKFKLYEYLLRLCPWLVPTVPAGKVTCENQKMLEARSGGVCHKKMENSGIIGE